MKNKIKILILIPIIIGIIIGIYYALTNFYSDKLNLKKINENVFCWSWYISEISQNIIDKLRINAYNMYKKI